MTTTNAVDTARFERFVTTERQREFHRDFLSGWRANEFWADLEVGVWQDLPDVFEVRQEDVLAYNRAVGEEHPLYVDPEYARAHAPGGSVLVHPIFATTVVFWFSQPGRQGSWIRTPGARNPFQHFVIHDQIRVGDRLWLRQENSERFLRRGSAYVTTHGLIRDVTGRTKVETWGTLILPRTREDVREYAEA
ncbi:MaoC family dehydratase [Gordonia sp. NPDC003424]